ncbi:DNA circularization N-terminal domain-containing protein [Orbaceae bacterium ESL0721]|nr:DNA circularization N-terminal domain-containing protein [Orbaceae bacterium ESL0721]
MSNNYLQHITGEGSFRGAKFWVYDKAIRQGGTEFKEYTDPISKQKVKSTVLSVKTLTTTFNAVVFGKDYIELRDKLIEALNQTTSGELKHPLYTSENVIISSWKVTHQIQSEQIATFEISYTSDLKSPLPRAQDDSETLMDDLTDSVGQNATIDFAQMINLYTDAVKEVEEFLDHGEALLNGITNAIRSITNGSKLASLMGKVKLCKASLNKLVSAPEKVASEIKDLIHGIAESDKPKSKRRVKTANSYGAGGATTSTRDMLLTDEQVKTPPAHLLDVNMSITQLLESVKFNIDALPPNNNAPFSALQILVNVIVMGEMVQAVVKEATAAVKYNNSNTIVTYADCEKTIKEQGDRLQALILTTSDNYWYQTARALQDLKHTFISQLEQLSTHLPQGRTAVMHATEPALVVLYRETGDASSVQQFSYRNALKHPTFVTGGRPYEVIDHA